MTSPLDYHQQLFAYLQAWRQVLEPLLPIPMPPKPATAPVVTPSIPTDYTTQLFGYLQAWRQYLEQMSGAGTAVPGPQPAADRPVETGSAQTVPPPPWWPNLPLPPIVDDGSRTTPAAPADPTSRSGDESAQPGPTKPPHILAYGPANPGGSQVPGAFQSAARARGPQLATAPEVEFGRRLDTRRSPATAAGLQTRLRDGSSEETAERVGPRTLFPGLAERALRSTRNYGS